MIPWDALIAVCESAYPNEACGWIASGPLGADVVREATVRGRYAFAFSDEDLVAFVVASRSSAPPQALFHSHPDGDAEMSSTDRDQLSLHPLPHVIVAVAAGRAHAATVYEWRDGAHVVVARWSRA